MSYRNLAQAPLDSEPLSPGPAKACKGCGADRVRLNSYNEVINRRLDDPRACTPYARVRVGWFARCYLPGEHLHEHCRVCGLRWLTAFARPK